MFNRGILDRLDNLRDAQFALTAAKARFHFKVQPNLFTGLSGGNGTGGGLQVSKRFGWGASLSFSADVRKSAGEYNSGIDFRLTQPLLKGFSSTYNLSPVTRARFALRTAQRNLDLARTGIILETVAALYDIIRKQKVLQLQQSSFQRLRGYAGAARVKQKKGYADALDVYRADLRFKQSQTLLANSAEQYRDALDNLKIILNLPLEQELRVSAPLDHDAVPMDREQALDTALENRPELRQLQDMLDHTGRGARAARHNLLPQLDLQVQYTSRGNNPDIWESFNTGKGIVRVGLVTGGDLARTGERLAYRRSQLALKSSQRAMSLLQDQVKRQVKNALRNLRRLAKNIQIQAGQVHDARGKMELSRIKFSHGMAGNFDLIESEAQYSRAEIEHTSSIIGYIVAVYRLKAVTGTLLEEYYSHEHTDE